MVSNGGGTRLAGPSGLVTDTSLSTGFMIFPIVGVLVMLVLVDGPMGGKLMVFWPDIAG